MAAEPILYVLIVLVCMLGLLVLLVFHKIRRVHQASYRIESLASSSTGLFAQIQAIIWLDRKLALDRPLPPTRGWAASPDFLQLVADKALQPVARRALECGSGTSTVVMARCFQLKGDGHVWSLDHDPAFAEKTRAALAAHGLEAWATVIDAPITPSASGQPWYAVDRLPPEAQDVDMLVIDGPPSTTSVEARYPAMPLLQRRLSAKCVVLLDDSARPDEQEILRRWALEFPEFSQRELDLEKGAAILERRDA